MAQEKATPPAGSTTPVAECRDLTSAELIPFLPLIYVAWADGDLSAEELGEISAAIEAEASLGTSCKGHLQRWLDPAEPPSATDLQRLLGIIRDGTAALSTRERLSLAEVGVELARTTGAGVDEDERRALIAVERALGIAGTEAARHLLATRRPAAKLAKIEPSFDVAAMTRLLDGRYRDIREQVRQVLQEPSFRHVYGLEKEPHREQVLRWCQTLAAHGFGALSFPPAQGGQADIGRFVAAFETIAFFDLSLVIKFGVQFGLFGGSIHQLGTERHHESYLRDVSTLALPGCFAMTETGHGSNVYDLETTARYDAATETFEIHTPHDGARKDYIGNAACHGRLATVFAQLEIGDDSHGVHAFLVPIRDEEGAVLPGVRVEDCGVKMGLNGVDNGRLWFDRVRIPRLNLLDRFAQVQADGTYESPIPSPSKRFFTMLGTLVGGRVSIAHAAVSAAKAALMIAVRYGEGRRQFGPAGKPELAILDYLTHQRRLLPRLATTYAIDFTLPYLLERFATSEDEDRREVEALAAGLKALSSWHATDTIQTCRECCGGQGFLAVNRFADLKADSDIFTTFEGDNVVLLQLVAKGLLSGFKKQFSSLTFFGLARYLAGRAAGAIAELNPLITRRTDEAHLRDREFQLHAFHWREEHLLMTVARRLKKRIDSGMDSQEALIACQDHLLEMAKAHVEHLVLKRFAAGVESTEDDGLRAMLTTLCDLFALERIERHRGWYLEHGYIENGKAKAITKLVNKLCRELRPQAVPLVDAFGIPMAVLDAPIAL